MLKGALLALVCLAVAGLLGAVVFLKSTGLRTQGAPGRLETAIARRARALAVPSEYSAMKNAVTADAESVREGMEHWADHCASCHGNDGSGDTQMGRNLFPPAPDMRAEATQRMSDGELFYVIEYGVRFTGMPGWSTGTAAGKEASWQLVHFIRKLPTLTPAELEAMADMNPRPPADVRQEIREERFLAGEDLAPAAPVVDHSMHVQ
jgi:mono/diheme cytochrome c family protein